MSALDNEKTTPTLIQTLNAVIDARLCELHTSMPAEVVSYDHASNLAVVQPSLRRKYKSEATAVNLPTISDVPVGFQRFGEGHLRIPVKSKDTGQLFFNERSIDGWLQSGGIIDPLDPRKHSLADAVFYPGLVPNNNPMKSLAAEDSVELKLKDAFIEILASGKFKIKKGPNELFDLTVQLGRLIEAITVNTIFGTSPINNAAAIKVVVDKIELMKG